MELWRTDEVKFKSKDGSLVVERLDFIENTSVRFLEGQ
jgi:hypothetical protein